MAFKLEDEFKQHTHNGADTKKLQLSDMEGSLSDITTPSATINDPSGGLTIDAQARSAIDDILDLLQEQGLME